MKDIAANHSLLKKKYFSLIQKSQKLLVYLYLFNFVIIKMKITFNGRNSIIFLHEMQKCTDETSEAYTVCKRGNKKIEIPFREDKPKREKIVLKFIYVRYLTVQRKKI